MARKRAPLEVEAKLLVPRASALRAIARLEGIGLYRLRPRDIVRLHSVYVDTPGLTLARRGIALRLRRQAGRWALTAKWAGRVAGLVHERPELTVALDKSPRFPLRVNGLLRRDLDALIAGQALKPILITQIHRRRIDVVRSAAPSGHQALAELALDRVQLCGPDDRKAAARYTEIEIERLHGTRRDVTRLAQLLQARFGLMPSTESKFAHGLRVLYGAEFRVGR